MATRGMIGTGIVYSRYVEVNAFDGFILSAVSFTDGATTGIDTKNDSGIVDNLTLQTVSFSDTEGVVLI